MSDRERAIEIALQHAWHNARTPQFDYDEWASLCRKLFGEPRPGQSVLRGLEDELNRALDAPSVSRTFISTLADHARLQSGRVLVFDPNGTNEGDEPSYPLAALDLTPEQAINLGVAMIAAARKGKAG